MNKGDKKLFDIINNSDDGVSLGYALHKTNWSLEKFRKSFLELLNTGEIFIAKNPENETDPMILKAL